MWNDGVAPETALDFDAPHVSKSKGLAMWLGGFAFFYGIWMLARSTDQPNNKPSVSLRAVFKFAKCSNIFVATCQHDRARATFQRAPRQQLWEALSSTSFINCTGIPMCGPGAFKCVGTRCDVSTQTGNPLATGKLQLEGAKDSEVQVFGLSNNFESITRQRVS